MDPQAVWTNLLDALSEGDWPAANEAAEALADWLQRGGFPPCTLTGLPSEHPLHRMFALVVCELVLHLTRKLDAAS